MLLTRFCNSSIALQANYMTQLARTRYPGSCVVDALHMSAFHYTDICGKMSAPREKCDKLEVACSCHLRRTLHPHPWLFFSFFLCCADMKSMLPMRKTPKRDNKLSLGKSCFFNPHFIDITLYSLGCRVCANEAAVWATTCRGSAAAPRHASDSWVCGERATAARGEVVPRGHPHTPWRLRWVFVIFETWYLTLIKTK